MNLYKFLNEFNFSELDNVIKKIKKETKKEVKNGFFYSINFVILFIWLFAIFFKSIPMFILLSFVFWLYNSMTILDFYKKFNYKLERILIFYFFQPIETNIENVDFFNYLYNNDDFLVLELKKLLKQNEVVELFDCVLEDRLNLFSS